MLIGLMISCSTTKKVGEQPVADGTSYEKAIIINERNEQAGVHAEYTWLKAHYPGYKLKSQELSFNKKKPYDILHILTDYGQEVVVYFNISKFFLKD
jgi:hypothetical protein